MNPIPSKPLAPELAEQILERVHAFFSDVTYVTKGQLLSFHEGSGMIPNSTTIENSIQRWGNHTHGIANGSMKLPEGVTWEHLQSAGVVDRYNGLLRVDLLSAMAKKSA